MKTKSLFILSLSFMLSISSFAQNYTTGIGLRGSSFHAGSGGINLKHFISTQNALELTVGGGNNHLVGTLLYEWQNSTGITPGLDWYIGAGGTVGSWRTNYVHPVHNNKTTYSSGFYLGGRAVIGLDYVIPGLPLNIAVDTGPYIGIINSNSFGWGGSFAIRYILN